MYRLQKNLVIVSVLMLIFVLSGRVFACSCQREQLTNKSIDEIRKEKRNYFLNEFSGAAFIGKIVERKRVSVNWVRKTESGKPVESQMYKYTIRVTEYWLGVKSRTITVYGEPPEQMPSRSYSSCGFTLDKGKTYFFTPSLEQKNLMIGQCDFARGGGSDPSKYPAIEFRKIMGEPKRF